jgi:hypothetical protein
VARSRGTLVRRGEGNALFQIVGADRAVCAHVARRTMRKRFRQTFLTAACFPFEQRSGIRDELSSNLQPTFAPALPHRFDLLEGVALVSGIPKVACAEGERQKNSNTRVR